MKLVLLSLSIFLASGALAQLGEESRPRFITDNGVEPTIYDRFLPACHDDSYCQLSCDVDGPNVNEDEEYYFCTEPDNCDEYLQTRSINGICNNVEAGRRLRGSIGASQLVRVLGEEFANVVSPRRVSDVIGAFSPTIPNTFGASTALVMFGQFIDHDVTIIHLEPTESKIIPGTGIVPDMLFQPSEAIGRENPRPVHINDLTAWVDLSQVYGSDPEVAEILREFSGGRMDSRIGADGQEYLPLVTSLEPIAMTEDVTALGFLPGSMSGGDVRVNEHLTLIAWHTLFVREHNRLAREYQADNPAADDEEIFQYARAINIAQYQNIVFGEYFDQWHSSSLPAYTEYNSSETPGIDIYFSTVTYRFGHSGVPNRVLRIDEDGNEVALPLGEVFFRPSLIERDGGVDGLLNGATQQCHERIDTYFQEGLRNALFNDIPGLINSAAMDLYSLNVARARDHALGSYSEARAFFGLDELQTFDEVTGGRDCVTELLNELYGVDNVAACDPFVCALAEPATRGEVGELLFASQRDHFRRLRDADRFFFENTDNDPDAPGPGFDAGELAAIRSVRIHDIIERNTFLQSQNPNAPNYLIDAFQTDRCPRSDGLTAGLNNDQVCMPNGDSEQFTLMDNQDQCSATIAVRDEGAFFPGSPECSATCFCAGQAAQAEDTIAGLPMGSFIGLIVGIVVGTVCLGVLGWIFYKRRKMARELDYTQSDHMSIASGASSNPSGYHGAPSIHSQAPSVNNYF